MVSTVTGYTDSRNRALPGEGFDGVVRVSVGGYYGTGTLLFDGAAILTAAHLYSHGSTASTVTFETVSGTQSLNASVVQVNPAYSATDENADVAIVWLDTAAPVAAQRYDIYRGAGEIGQTFEFVGYGQPGTGSAGVLTSYTGPPIREKAFNRFDTDAADLKMQLGGTMGWSPAPGTQLLADFDNGTTTNDALGRLASLFDLGLGDSEGLISPGDSGGPAFLGNQVVGVASYSASLSYGSISPDIDSTVDSSFGEIAAWQRVSAYQQWIDQTMRAHYANVPLKPSDVKTLVPEGSSGTTVTYFLVQFTGTRTSSTQVLSVDYATRDGTALANKDYLPVHGTLKLYPGETQAVIPVEIIGDTTPEPDETFYLDVTNPVGGSFGDGLVKLTASRTIVNDDGAWLV